jgi:cellulose synthase/poly-beta-1,6-N-acetylglucosamine synthase-like glycosyltransferase
MRPLDALTLATYYGTLGLLVVYSLHRLHLVRLRATLPAALPVPPMRIWPSVTVQLPVFNEPNVVGRLIDAAAALEYPGELLVQVLDDSTDETSSIAAGRVKSLRASGVRIEHVRRTTRAGYKAGALANGMALSDSQLYAVFDADFLPPRDLLTRMVPPLADASVGMVQARWGHLNAEESALTRVEAIYLDAHFAVESAARHLRGCFFNFNGTAGIWRREAIEEAGGWSASTLTEDLDLSYRSQLAGWKFVFLPDVVVPAELPSTLAGFHQQQHRWAKGSIQTARKILPRLFRSRLPRHVKCEAAFHLTNNSAYLLTVLLALLIVPAIVIRQRLGVGWTIGFDVALFIASTGSVLVFYIEGQRWAGRPRPRVRDLLWVLPIGVGISLRNAAAVIEGALQHGGSFDRTPKRGSAPRATVERRPRLPVGEIVLALFFCAAAATFLAARQWASLPFLTLFLSGYGSASVQALRERSSYES